jgi:protein-S-isoprenylcysteine O-methyltransferase Ste14
VLSQAVLLPNWIASPAGLVGFGTLFAFWVRKEEQMMLDAFRRGLRRLRRPDQAHHSGGVLARH